jgi:hypothetical protein
LPLRPYVPSLCVCAFKHSVDDKWLFSDRG